jgi:hypothetical protein
MQEPQSGIELLEQSIHSSLADARDLEAGLACGTGRGLSDGMDPQAAQQRQTLPSVPHRIGAGQKQAVEFSRIGRPPFDRLDLEKGHCNGV